MKEWTPEYDKTYWEKYPKEYYLKAIANKVAVFGIKDFLFENCLDVGGGAYGGALRFIDSGTKFLVDPLASWFLKRGTLPEDVASLDVFEDRFLELFEGSMNAIFAWELFDRLSNKDALVDMQNTLIRLLSADGCLYVHHLIRDIPIEGHPFPISVKLLDEGFASLGKKVIKKTKNEYYVVYRRIDGDLLKKHRSAIGFYT